MIIMIMSAAQEGQPSGQLCIISPLKSIFKCCNLSHSPKRAFFRGVQKLEQGGVRASFMGAVQVGSETEDNNYNVNIDCAITPEKNMYKSYHHHFHFHAASERQKIRIIISMNTTKYISTRYIIPQFNITTTKSQSHVHITQFQTQTCAGGSREEPSIQ